jgi:glutamine amidotransferase
VCRLLAVTAATPFAIPDHLARLAEIARTSREYQGHGWGCAWHEGGEWRSHRSLVPIWEDDLSPFGRTRVLMAHARSAFRDEGIVVENNMPFLAPPFAFVFNGELRGVRLAEQGRIGAEKLFHFLLRSGAAAGADALGRSLQLVERRTRYVRAMNLVLGGSGRFLVGTSFNEDEDYFTLHAKRDDRATLVCSRPYAGEAGWQPVPNGSIEAIPWFS